MELQGYEQTALSQLKDRFSEARYDPTMLTKVALETVEQITNGEAVMMDASNPFVMQLEMAATQTAACVQENLVLLRRQYPSLAMTEEELYLHMSDEDYLNRFASPSTPATFTFCFQTDDIFREAKYDSSEKAYKLIMPRDTKVVVDGVTFTLLYPIVIRRYENGAMQISYDPTIPNPVFTLKNTIIDPKVRQGTEGELWVFFDVQMLQVEIQSEHFTIDKTYAFRKEVVLNDMFYYARVFYKNENTSNTWVEIETTHTDQVFDVRNPTAVLKVAEDSLVVEIPVIYTTTDKLSGQVRVDIYNTRGEMTMDLKNFRQDAFEITMMAVDEQRDLNVYTQAMQNVSYYVYSLDLITGGKKSITFEELRERVIYNAIGPQNLPITNVQLEAEAVNNGFEIVRNVDVLTNRILLATRKLPKPSQSKLITPANIGVVSWTGRQGDLADHYKVIVNNGRTTIRSKTFWKSDNSQLSLLSREALDAIYAMGQTAMVNHINSNQYFYTPFYYVLDGTRSEFEIRTYALDQPYAKDQNFVSQNHTLQLFVNTGAYELKKVYNGYELRLKTKSANYYKGLEDSQVGIQLAFFPKGETTYAYLNGTLEQAGEDGERTFLFHIETNHDLDENGLLCITNATVQGITSYKAWIDLETVVEVLHYTTSLTSQYRPDASDGLLGKFMLPTGVAGNSHEQLTLHFGDALKNLWRRSRSYMKDVVYRTHTVDVPLLYTEDIYDVDPETGSAFTFDDAGELQYLYLHREGDPVLDIDGQPVMKYRIGEVMLDENNEPVVEENFSIYRDIDILVADGRYLFADDTATVAYREEIESVLTEWIMEDLSLMQQRLLDRTMIFFYPKTTLGIIEVVTENAGKDYLPAEQNFNLDLYVRYSIYNDPVIRENLRTATVTLLDEYISRQTINMTEIRGKLRDLYGESVSAFTISGLGGDRDYQLIRVVSERNKLCLKKHLIAQADKTMYVQDAVSINFKVVE